MTRGTASFGKRGKRKTHVMCRRCGRHTFHTRKKRCSFCGFGASPRLRRYGWLRR